MRYRSSILLVLVALSTVPLYFSGCEHERLYTEDEAEELAGPDCDAIYDSCESNCGDDSRCESACDDAKENCENQ